MRELENVVERAVVLARGARVEVADLPDSVVERDRDDRPRRRGDGAEAAAPRACFQIRVGHAARRGRARLLEETLRMTKGNKTLTARCSASTRRTVFRKLKAGEAEEGGGRRARRPGKAAGG